MRSVSNQELSKRCREKSSLSRGQSHLVELMQRINYGRIEGLVISRGEPVLEPAPRVVRKLKLGGKNAPRPEMGKDNFELKAEIVELFCLFEQIGDGLVRVLTVERGLPKHIEIEDCPEPPAVSPVTSPDNPPAPSLTRSAAPSHEGELAAM
jgi:hypothetical protein